MADKEISVLLIEDNAEFAKLVSLYLQKDNEAKFVVTWKPDGETGMEAIEDDDSFDVILMDYFLPGETGFEVTRKLNAKEVKIPIVFLTANREFDLVLEVMKLGVEDYLVKEEILSPVLPKTLLNVLERRDLKRRLEEIEISEKRLQAIQELVVSVTAELDVPVMRLRERVEALKKDRSAIQFKKQLATIEKSLGRIEQKLRRLKDLKEAKSVPYVKDVRMIDLSE
ncbi:MAG: response regulator [Bacteroidota bacterium]